MLTCFYLYERNEPICTEFNHKNEYVVNFLSAHNSLDAFQDDSQLPPRCFYCFLVEMVNCSLSKLRILKKGQTDAFSDYEQIQSMQ